MNLDGLLLLNKNSGVSSHQVVDKLRRILRFRKIGHAGTLDPAATGLLVVCVGKGLKIVQFLFDYDKEYIAQIRLGVSTDTYDREGKIVATNSDCQPSKQEIERALLSFKGEIWQTPPVFSALKYKGRKLYEYARAGEKVEKEKRKVKIKDIQAIELDFPYLKFTVCCSKGTYIRSLANQMGEKLGIGAYLSSLCRTRVGPFDLKDALTIEQIEEFMLKEKITSQIIPIEAALENLPGVVVKEDFASRIKNGPPLHTQEVIEVEKEFDSGELISLKNRLRQILAVGKSQIASEGFLRLSNKRRVFEYKRVIA